MNLKHYYYRTYFSNLDLHQPESKDARKKIEKINEPKLKAHNQILTSAAPMLMSPSGGQSTYALPPGNVAPLCLYVQNPGLLPGIGYPHEVSYAGEFKLGMHFDHTSGLPCLPGSSVKGALRALWPQYAYAETMPDTYKPDAKTAGKAELQAQKARFIFKLLQSVGAAVTTVTADGVQAFVHRLELALFEGWIWPNDGKSGLQPMSKRAVFFDAFPITAAKTRDGDQLLGRDALTPHGDNPLKNPIPLPFLKVMPGVVYAFSFRLSDIVIGNSTVSRQNLLDVFAILLEKSGVGAKTNVGYGRFSKTMEINAEMPASPQNGGRKNENTGNGGPTGGQKPPTMKRDPKSITKWRPRNEIYAKSVEIVGKDVLFSSDQIEEPDWLLVVKNAPLIDRLIPGKVFKLSISSIDMKTKRVLASVADFTALDQ